MPAARRSTRACRSPTSDRSRCPSQLDDDKVLFLSDIFPTGYMAADMCGIQPGDVVAVWGCGPVGQFAIKSAYLLGAERVIAIDRFDYRLRMARERAGAETIDYEQTDVHEALKEMTGGRGPDHCIDAVGHGRARPRTCWAPTTGEDGDDAGDRPRLCAAPGDPGVPQRRHRVGGRRLRRHSIDKFPMGAIVNRSLTIRSGQCHVQRYMRPLLERIERGEIDPSFVITHHMRLDQAAEGLRHVQQQAGRVPEGRSQDLDIGDGGWGWGTAVGNGACELMRDEQWSAVAPAGLELDAVCGIAVGPGSVRRMLQ